MRSGRAAALVDGSTLLAMCKRLLDNARHALLHQQPRFGLMFRVFLLASAVLYVRSPFSNSIFDEQEALLANPYVNGNGVGFFQVLQRDFWGLLPDRSIGSYRPLPNLIWRCLWAVHDHPWVPHAFNVVLHALNAALLGGIAWAWLGSSAVAWLSGAAFVSCAVLTETVSGAVGLADVLSGSGLLAALALLALPLGWMGLGVFAVCTLALFSKESSVALVAMVPWAALLSAPLLHRGRPLAFARALVALGATALAVVLYVEVRRRCFPSPIAAELLTPLSSDQPWPARLLHELQRWFAQPRLPHDPINNPLVDVSVADRVTTALRIYLSGLGQVLFPWTLSGDYSYAAELPERTSFSTRAMLGALCFVVPMLCGLWLGALSLWSHRAGQVASFRSRAAALLALGCLMIPVSYFPQSNLLVLLPTIRAERFWYLPVVGSAWLLGWLLCRVWQAPWRIRRRHIGVGAVAVFLGFQGVQARRHAFDYSSDLHFWGATAKASPGSAKAHLNYGVMLGARGDLALRLEETMRAIVIAPRWPMAHIYYGDTLCRMKRGADAWPHYRRGFELGPDDPNLIALGLQCLWEAEQIRPREQELRDLTASFPDSWLDYLVHDLLEHGEKNDGVDKKYRPRGYDEGPK